MCCPNYSADTSSYTRLDTLVDRVLQRSLASYCETAIELGARDEDGFVEGLAEYLLHSLEQKVLNASILDCPRSFLTSDAQALLGYIRSSHAGTNSLDWVMKT